MARKGNNKKKRKAEQRRYQKPTMNAHEQQEAWRRLWSEEQRSGDRDLSTKLSRPPGVCPTCRNPFLKNDPFHYSSIGVVHGWGRFDETDTCRFRPQSTVKRPPNNQCLECGKTIFKSDRAHAVSGGGRIHGTGKLDDRGTCVFRHQQDIERELSELADGFLDGSVTEADVEALIPELRAREERLDAAYAKHVA